MRGVGRHVVEGFNEPKIIVQAGDVDAMSQVELLDEVLGVLRVDLGFSGSGLLHEAVDDLLGSGACDGIMMLEVAEESHDGILSFHDFVEGCVCQIQPQELLSCESLG